MFGFSPVMINGKRGFSLSGTFATGLDGWAGSGMSWNASTAGGGSTPRTNPGLVYGNGYLEFTVPGSVCGGLDITASIYQRGSSSLTSTRTFKYKIGSGSFVTIGTVNDTSASYAQFSDTFNNPGTDDVTFRIEGSHSAALFDDWLISGE